MKYITTQIANMALREIVKNLVMGIGPVRRMRLRRRRTATTAPSLQTLFIYAFRLPSICIKYGGSVVGKEVIEIGPGDNLANGLTFLALGAKSYTALDRFPGPYSSPTAKSWYRLTRDNFEGTFGHKWPDLSPESFPEAYPTIRTFATPVESAPALKADIVCSHNVAEHVSDLRSFAEANKRMLNANGIAIHVVDFGGHNWELDPHDPFMFRRLPSWLWSAMGSNRGYPNRIPFDEFTSIMRESGLDVFARDLKPFRYDAAVQEATFVCKPRLSCGIPG